MGNRAECPVCNSYTSSVWSADNDGEPCPSCGAPFALRLEVTGLRRRNADERLTGRVVELGQQLAQVTSERDRLRRQLDAVRYAIEDDE